MHAPGERSEAQSRETYRIVGRILGPVVFVLFLVVEPLQSAMEPLAWRAAAAGLWMAIWWATEAIPVPVTAFLPLVLFAPLGIATMREAAAPYANPTIYLFLGGFMMALALERWNLHRRIALAILDRTGTDGRRLIGGFMLVCAGLSMWMTNTSTTMMLLPIVLSVISVIRDNVTEISEKAQGDFEIAMLLALAYSASIGGLATLVGTPPNALLIGFLADNYDIEISFARWMAVGLPVRADATYRMVRSDSVPVPGARTRERGRQPAFARTSAGNGSDDDTGKTCRRYFRGRRLLLDAASPAD